MYPTYVSKPYHAGIVCGMQRCVVFYYFVCVLALGVTLAVLARSALIYL